MKGLPRKWMIAGAVVALLAVIGGAYAAGNLLFVHATSPKPATPARSARPAKPSRPAVIVFHETVSDVSLRYPGSWTRRASADPSVALLAVAPDKTTSLLVRVSVTGLGDITRKTLPIVRQYTDPLIKTDKTVKLLGPPQAVTLGGLLGYHYRYTYHSGAGAHDHYFLFKRGRMIALVFQTMPASRFNALIPQFDRLAGTFRGSGT